MEYNVQILLYNSFLYVNSNKQTMENKKHKKVIDDFKTAIILIAHPDDETAMFSGVIYDAVNSNKTIKVVVATCGDGNWKACDFWKNGCPVNGENCKHSNKTDMEEFGKTRLNELRDALEILGLKQDHITALGYPDGKLNSMFQQKDSIFIGNTLRNKSFTSNPFTFRSILDDIKNVLRKHPDSTIFTLHIKDQHKDHSAMAKFTDKAVKELAEEGLSYKIYWAIGHEPLPENNRNSNNWPNPAYMSAIKGKHTDLRETRYQPEGILNPPELIDEKPNVYPINKKLWQSENGEKPIMRKAIEAHKTQTGHITKNGTEPESAFLGYLDSNGYLLSFIKQNHLLWEAYSIED